MAAGRDRPVAALSAVFDDDDRLLARRHGGQRRCGKALVADTRAIRSYPIAPGFVAAVADLVADALRGCRRRRCAGAPAVQRAWLAAEDRALPAIPTQARSSARRRLLCDALARPGLDWRVCYQSRVGPLAWLGPSVEEELRRAGRDGIADCHRADLICLRAFGDACRTRPRLSALSRGACGVPAYHRVPTVGTDPRFIAALAELVRESGRAAQPGDIAAACAGPGM